MYRALLFGLVILSDLDSYRPAWAAGRFGRCTFSMGYEWWDINGGGEAHVGHTRATNLEGC